MNGFSRNELRALTVGLFIRLLLIATAIPVIYTTWFLPFLHHASTHLTLDPWTSFLLAGGNSRAFPYGPIYFAFLPFTAVGQYFGLKGAALALLFANLFLDAALLLLLRSMADRPLKAQITYAYWLSPIVVYACYWHGQLDLLPVLILTAALALLQRHRFKPAGAVLGLATAAKLSMGLAIPFVWIYVTVARRLRSRAPQLIAATCMGLATILPFLLSSGFRHMVIDTPESAKIFSLAIVYGDLTVYVTPLVLAGLVIAAWRIRRFDFDILFSLIGIGFLVVFLLTPASPGWSLWLMPFLALHVASTGREAWIVTLGFSLLFVLFHVLTSSGAILPFTLPHVAPSARTLNLLLSLYLASGGLILFQMLRIRIIGSPYYRSSRKPLTLGIAGDSGSGKDTLAEALRGLFGRSATALISGDDYHSWDRHKPMWRAFTHLNPAANNLPRFNADVLNLRAGHTIAVSHYDHRIGRMAKPHHIRPRDVIIASGLHALHSPEMNQTLDLGIFLAMDEPLRRYLKIRRDVRIRGHSLEAVLASLDKRESDSARYIRPQAKAAHLILSLVAHDPRELADPLGTAGELRMSLRVEVPTTSDLDDVARVLVGIGGLDVLPCRAEEGRHAIEISGQPSAADIAASAAFLVPQFRDYLAIQPRWSSGLIGIMQLLVIDQLRQRLALKKDS